MLIGLTWPLRHRALLWVLLVFIAGTHLLFLLTAPLPSKISYGIAFSPLVAIDIYLFWKLIIFFLKLFDRDHMAE